MYLDIEAPSADHSRAQVGSALANGCSVGAYLWLYRGADPVATAQEAIALAREQFEPPVMWIDWESYTDGSYPPATDVLRCAQACEAEGVRAGTYTGKWFVDKVGGSQILTDYPLWSAQYSGGPTFDDIVPYGGWTVENILGKQYRGSPLDLNVFYSSVT